MWSTTMSRTSACSRLSAVGSDLAESDRLFRRAEEFVTASPLVERTFLVIGGFGGGEVNTGVIFVTMKPRDQRSASQSDFAAVLRKELNSYPGLRTVVQDMSQQGFTAQRGFPVEFSIRGPEWGELVQQSERMRADLSASGLVV